MNVFDYLLAFTKVLTWPAIVLFLVIRFKDSLKTLLDKITELKAGPAGVAVQINADVQKHIKKEDEGVKKDLAPLLKKHKTQLRATKKMMEAMQQQLEETQLRLGFEQTYNFIFGSQLAALQRLEDSGGTMGAASLIPNFIDYSNASKLAASPSHYLSIGDWMAFPITRGLAESLTGEKYSITKEGRVFLSYLRTLKYPLNKPL